MWGVYAPDRDPNSENDGVVCIADYLSEDVARLVAAAPDLLAALKELVGQLERMRAAIALAEGKP
jgi:hypothetical protein